MNLEIANRLVEYRKKAGLSQEELADKLGISRQAVSKWERVEASPDTDNLIALAELYGVTLDELIHGPKADEAKSDTIKDNAPAGEEVSENPKEENDTDDQVVIDDDGIKVTSDSESIVIDDDGVKINKGDETVVVDAEYVEKKVKMEKPRIHLVAWLNTLFGILALLGFFLIGSFCKFTNWSTGAEIGGYAVSWILFIVSPVIPSLVDAIISRNITKFNVPCLVTGTYLALGMLGNMWHPMWALFFVIPAYYSLFGPIHNYLKKNREYKKSMKE